MTVQQSNNFIRLQAVIIIMFTCLLTACSNGDKVPDVSSIKIDITVQRFEQDFFAADTNNLPAALDKLNATYPGFLSAYLVKVLNADIKLPNDSIAMYIRNFITPYRTVNDSAQKLFADFSPHTQKIKQALQFLQHYFPEYKAPKKVITFIGPLDGVGDAISPDAFIVGLQAHLGGGSYFYQNEMVQQIYPAYVSRQFEPGTIAINCMKNVMDDMTADKDFSDRPMVEQMVEAGKKLYILSKLLPYEPEYKLIDYTEIQLKDSYAHEAQIWDLFVQNNYLQVSDKNIIKNYIGPSPKTQELGEASPGNIGSFAGWQIVKKYMGKNPTTTLSALLQLNANEIYQQAKYKP